MSTIDKWFSILKNNIFSFDNNKLKQNEQKMRIKKKIRRLKKTDKRKQIKQE